MFIYGGKEIKERRREADIDSMLRDRANIFNMVHSLSQLFTSTPVYLYVSIKINTQWIWPESETVSIEFHNESLKDLLQLFTRVVEQWLTLFMEICDQECQG